MYSKLDFYISVIISCNLLVAVRRVKVHMRCLTVFGSCRGLVKAQNNRLQGVLAIKLDIFIAWVVIRHPNLLMKPTSLR